MKNQKGGNKAQVKSWLPVIGLTFSAFVFNTSEFVPIGLLSDIATDFQISEAHAGLLITIYAWVVALVSLPLMMLLSKLKYCKLLFMVIGLFIASHLLSAIANTYLLLMISRIGVACSHAIFWSIASPLAVQVAPNGQRSVALSLLIRLIPFCLPQTALKPVHGFCIHRCLRDQVDPVICNKWQKLFLYICQHLVNAHGTIPGFGAKQQH